MAGLALAFAPQVPADSSYETHALRELVAEVARRNRSVPVTLAGYSARVEAEAALVRTDADGRERVISLQQIALRVAWARDGTYSEHAVGERAMSRGVIRYDALKVPSFTIPVLYGNRLDLLLGPYGANESARDASHSAAEDALHPLAEGRERIYAYRGGDVAQRMAVGGRAITIARIRVVPLRVPKVRTSVFAGDIFVDVERRQLVWMRGRIQEIGGHSSGLKRVAASLVREVGHIEVITAELDGRYWLPVIERVDLRLSSPLAQREGIGLRISSRFLDIDTDVRAEDDADLARDSVLVAAPRRISLATADSLRSFTGWSEALGEATAADDFRELTRPFKDDSIAVVATRPEIGTRTFGETLRFNRVEGLFTGIGVIVPAPWRPISTSLVASGGRAWSEGAFRGRVGLEDASAAWRAGAVVARSLDGTNDFTYIRDRTAPFLAALLSVDNYDYVDRRSGTLFAERQWRGSATRLRVEAAHVRDHGVARSIRHGLVRTDSAFRPNRPVTPGRFTRGAMTLDVNPNVLTEYLHPGIGMTLRAEAARGELTYARVEGRMTAQHVVRGGLTLAARADVGALFARDSIPLQQLFELGGPAQLPGFRYKAFGGDRAALGQLSATLPVQSLTGQTPASRAIRSHLSATLFLGAVSSSTSRVASAVSTLRMDEPPCSVATLCARDGGLHSSVQVGLRFFDGAIFVGAIRKVSEADRWRLALSAGVF